MFPNHVCICDYNFKISKPYERQFVAQLLTHADKIVSIFHVWIIRRKYSFYQTSGLGLRLGFYFLSPFHKKKNNNAKKPHQNPPEERKLEVWNFAHGLNLMEDDLWFKTTFEWRRPLMEDILWCKRTFDGRQTLMEDNLWWQRTYNGRQPLMEDNFLSKVTLNWRQS